MFSQVEIHNTSNERRSNVVARDAYCLLIRLINNVLHRTGVRIQNRRTSRRPPLGVYGYSETTARATIVVGSLQSPSAVQVITVTAGGVVTVVIPRVPLAIAGRPRNGRVGELVTVMHFSLFSRVPTAVD